MDTTAFSLATRGLQNRAKQGRAYAVLRTKRTTVASKLPRLSPKICGGNADLRVLSAEFGFSSDSTQIDQHQLHPNAIASADANGRIWRSCSAFFGIRRVSYQPNISQKTRSTNPGGNSPGRGPTPLRCTSASFPMLWVGSVGGPDAWEWMEITLRGVTL